MSVKTDIRPISITPIAAKGFESIIMKYVDDIVCDTIDSKQFGGIAGTSTTDALVEMTGMRRLIYLTRMSVLSC